jgi:hypothetical protein
MLSRCPFLWGPSFACSRLIVGFYLAFGHLSELLFLLPYANICSYGGVDNAIIKREVASTRLICPLWFGLMMSDCQRVASRVESKTDRGMRLCMCNHVSQIVVCRCGVHGWWSTAEVKVMQAHADGSGAVKDECLVLANRPEQPDD